MARQKRLFISWDGVLSWYPGDALWEIARRAGVRGLKGSDVVADTLPLIAEIILLRCKPIKYPEKTGVV